MINYLSVASAKCILKLKLKSSSTIFDCSADMPGLRKQYFYLFSSYFYLF